MPKSIFNSDNDNHTKEFKINLIAHCSFADASNRIRQKISIPISINNTGMIIGTLTTDGQPCEAIAIDNWNDKNERYRDAAYFVTAIVLIATIEILKNLCGD